LARKRGGLILQRSPSRSPSPQGVTHTSNLLSFIPVAGDIITAANTIVLTITIIVMYDEWLCVDVCDVDHIC